MPECLCVCAYAWVATRERDKEREREREREKVSVTEIKWGRILKNLPGYYEVGTKRSKTCFSLQSNIFLDGFFSPAPDPLFSRGNIKFSAK